MASQKRLKIAFIHPDLGIGGAERLVLDVAVALKKQNHDVLFVTNHFDKNHAFEELKNDEFPVSVYGDWLPRSIFGKCQALCAYVRMIYLTIVFLLFGQGDIKPDLYFIDLIPIAIPFLKLGGKKVVYYCHHPDLLASTPGGTLKKLYRIPINWMELKATGMSDIILVNSEYTASVFRETFPEIKKPIQILYPTIAQSYQESVNKLKTVKPIREVVTDIQYKKNDVVVFLSVNRFHPAKRLDFAINAMEKLRSLTSASEWEKIFLVVAGGFDPINQTNAKTFEELTNLTKQKNLEGKIIFLKSPSDSTKVDLLASCTTLLYTPLKEHFGIVPLEAMLVSKPVIAMNSGGPRETVEHGVTGYLCEPTSDSMAEFMHKIIKNGTKDMGSKGKRKLEEKFSLDSFAKRLRSVIKEVIEVSKKTK
ncbi:alpha-1,3/1,6-mannosyltransferase ALG2-like [Anthonomus grandis grandis]|uniref:alpha-1,3/1,6-mannosyltransferase ALG2-like n=1 Tax=Anthonomus grandis grandis TaxID=2921223 RepID=UPI002166B250|nr:alpha-1,3/1,6-mannosyltransferase ALG2-like [Anthonomus grandis grandis]